MPTLARLPHWGMIFLAVGHPLPAGGRMLMFLIVAFLPSITVWLREAYATRGMDVRGPASNHRFVSATIETVAGFAVATFFPLLPIGFAALVICWMVDWTSYLKVDLEIGESTLVLRRRSGPTTFALSTLQVRRDGPFFTLTGGGKSATVKFGTTRAEEIDDELTQRGVAMTREPSADWGVGAPLLAAVACSVAAVAFVKH